MDGVLGICWWICRGLACYFRSDGIMLDGMDVAVWDDDFRWMAREIVRHVVMMGSVVIYGSIADWGYGMFTSSIQRN